MYIDDRVVGRGDRGIAEGTEGLLLWGEGWLESEKEDQRGGGGEALLVSPRPVWGRAAPNNHGYEESYTNRQKSVEPSFAVAGKDFGNKNLQQGFLDIKK